MKHRFPMVSIFMETQRLAAGVGKNIVIYDLKTGKEAQTLEGHAGNVLALSFSPNGKQLVSYGVGDEVRFWCVTGPLPLSLSFYHPCLLPLSFVCLHVSAF